MNKSNPIYEVTIIGAGVSGTALLYMLARYTNVKYICLLEKYRKPAQVNSLPSHNSQTLHSGDIETNYTLSKALEVQRAAKMVRNYVMRRTNNYSILHKYPKMVLGVGKAECDKLRARFKEFKPHYPNLKLMDWVDIAQVEPSVAYHDTDKQKPRGRDILALGSTSEYTAVNFEKLSNSFINTAISDAYDSNKIIDIFCNKEVDDIEKPNNIFNIRSGNSTFHTETVVTCAGGHSLHMAHRMGHGLQYSVLPIAGSYYFTPQVLKGKVYTVQHESLPFAAVHGDPDVQVPEYTRFGPTALVLPILERYNISTLPDFLQVFNFDKQVALVLWDLLKNKEIRNYIFKNMLYEIPGIRRMLFLKEVRKIVPTVELGDLKFAKRVGGIRPQLIDKDNRKLVMGEAKIDEGDGIIFNVTPSPGGTSCLENAEIDMRAICERLGATIDEELLRKELLE